MGILTGLFKSIMLTRMINTKQHRMTQIQSRLRRVHKEYSNAEKYINQYKKNATAEIKSLFTCGGGAAQYYALGKMFGNDALKDVSDQEGIYKFMQQNLAGDTVACAQYQDLYSYYTNSQNQMQQIQLQNIEDEVEAMKESMLEPLKDEEEDLQVEYETLQTQIKLYEQWKQGAQEETQSGIKNFKPLGSGSSYG